MDVLDRWSGSEEEQEVVLMYVIGFADFCLHATRDDALRQQQCLAGAVCGCHHPNVQHYYAPHALQVQPDLVASQASTSHLDLGP